MPKSLIAILKVLISVGLAAFLLYLVFQNVEWEDFLQKAKSVDYSWVIISILLSIVAYVARAYRWNILLEPLGYELKTLRTTLAVLIGYLANLALPRLGEITRCGVLNRNDRVPVSVGLGSVVSERVVDLFTLFLLIIISLIIESERLLSFLGTAYRDLNIPFYAIYIVIAIGIFGLIGFVLFVRSMRRRSGKVANLINGFISGLLSLKSIKQPIGFFLSTVVLWVIYYLMSYLIVFSLPETAHLGLGAGFMLLVTGGIAISLPVQSGFGTYHGMIAGMLLLYSIEETTGIFLATLLHTSQIIAITIFGTIAIVLSVLIRKKSNESLESKEKTLD